MDPKRLVTVEEWLDISKQSPVCTIPGWSPWSYLVRHNIWIEGLNLFFNNGILGVGGVDQHLKKLVLSHDY